MSESRVPGWVWITTPTLALAFAGFLLYLSTLPSSDETEAVKGDAKAALQAGIDRVRKEVESTTAQPSYDFYKLLEKQKVEVPEVQEYKSTPKDEEIGYQYWLQAGSFRGADEADSMRAELLLLGLTAVQESATVNSSTWHRVFVGPFTDRSRLNKAQDVLVANDISPLLIKKPLPAQ